MSTDAPQPEVWYEGKAFKREQHLDDKDITVVEFRGAKAKLEGVEWFNKKIYDPDYDAVYLYECQGEERKLHQSHADIYPWDGTDEDDDDEWWDDVTHDADDDAELDWAAGECSMMADGQCGQAGSEHCDFECPFRDGEIVEVESDETKGQ